MQEKWTCRIAPSLGGGFAGTPEEVWGTQTWTDCTTDVFGPVVFFGLYGFKDFYSLWQHKGERAILWAGSDITHFKNGYWLDDEGKIKMDPKPLAEWINENCDSYVENELERRELNGLGIESKVVPSFLGDVNDYGIVYEKPSKPRFYTSVSGNDFSLYGWDDIEDLSDDYPDVDFYLYGNTEPWYTDKPNIIVRGRVPQTQMDHEIMDMTGALRLTRHDGFSEILAKSVLWGQWPVSPYIEYPGMLTNIGDALDKDEPNIEGREYYLEILNKYPWSNQQKST